MDCDKAHRRMYRYLDGEITVWRRWRISRHLGKCPPCADGFVFEVELREVIASRCRDTVPDDVKHRIAEAIDKACREHQAAAENQPAENQADAGRGVESS
jgi:mycothiol system anti-sigma-R factor